MDDHPHKAWSQDHRAFAEMKEAHGITFDTNERDLLIMILIELRELNGRAAKGE